GCFFHQAETVAGAAFVCCSRGSSERLCRSGSATARFAITISESIKMTRMRKEKSVLAAKSDKLLLNGFVLALLKRMGSNTAVRNVMKSLVDKCLAVYPNPGPTQYLYAGGLLYASGQRSQAKP